MTALDGMMPFWIAAFGALALLGWEAALGEKGRRLAPAIGGGFLLSALVSDLLLLSNDGGAPGPFFSNAVTVDPLCLASGATSLLSALLAAAFAAPYLRREKAVTGEFYSLLLFAASGAWLLAAAAETITLFVALELLSLPAYVLAGYMRVKNGSAEAALKYFLPGAFASALYLYGAALLYGASGSTSLEGLRDLMSLGGTPAYLVKAGGALVLAAFAFKVAAAPFHAWAPDVYEGAPAPSVVFLSTGVKAAGFTVLVRIFADILPGWGGILAALALLTMVIGNLGALAQGSVKRMLAYSSVAHAGYLFVGLAVAGQAPAIDVARAVVFYLAAYTFMTAGAFGWLSHAAGGGEKALNFTDFEGYALKRPVTALAMTIFLFSLAGMPPTAGFFGKYLLFKMAVENGMTPLALVAVFFSLISFAYYLRLAISMYMKPATEKTSDPGPAPFLHQAALLLCVIGVLLLGFLPMAF